MQRAQLMRTDYERSPYLAWNVFISEISDLRGDMTPLQQDAAKIFLYESEVQNGSHLQYFENQGRESARLAVEALERLGVRCQQQVLAEALKVWNSSERKPIHTADRYVEVALEGEFDGFDRSYAKCNPSVQEHLERLLATHFNEFIELI